ncbi:hypothetical protein Golomagni_02100 [Golovinomyces magnicellulatus]|nr:hypothetical protein Golomagni_02100 [Golovinomyces magnicellulatus]
MKTIPSLIASSTIGIAATGLVLGKQEPSQVKKARRTGDALYSNYNPPSSSPRPGTSFTNCDVVLDCKPPSVFSSESKKKLPFKSHRRPPLTHTNKSKLTHPPKPSSLKIKDTASCHDYHPEEEDRTRESISSRGSWIRRLSSRPTSHSHQANSALEVQNESSSQTNYNQPLSRHENDLVPHHRNRLVKRIPRGRAMSGSEAAVRSQQKTNFVRRPATSQHHFYFSFQQPEGTEFSDHPTQDSLLTQDKATKSHRIWRLYFQPKSLEGIKNLDSEKQENQGDFEISPEYKRFVMDECTSPTLIKPEMIGRSRASHLSYQDHSKHETGHSSDEEDDDFKGFFFRSRPQSRDETTKRPRRSFSMQFVSPVSWLPRPGNIMGLRRNYRGKIPNHQTPLNSKDTKVCRNISAHSMANTRHTVFEESTYQSKIAELRNSRPGSEQFTADHNSKSRNNSSPLPSLSRFSTLSVDLDRVGLTSSSSSPVPTDTITHASKNCLSTFCDNNIAVKASFPSTGQGLSKHSRLSVNSIGINLALEIADRASTLVGSDYDVRGFTSWDEDDTDLQSETVYDSMRSGATGTTQSLKLPLEYIFDGTPSIAEYNFGINPSDKYETIEYDRFSLGRCQTMRDDNLFSSSNKGRLLKNQYSFPSNLTKITNRSDNFSESISIDCLKLNGFEHKSPEDKGWNSEEKKLEPHHDSDYSSKYCRTKNSYEKFRRIPFDENQDESEEPNHHERSKTNVFDWSEPSPLEKNDDNGNFPRPRTAHVKQLMDGRNGRALGRRGPSAVHVRSQSVPVIPDADLTKLTTKFGTWGLSSKIITEDWDGDFEFENVDSEVMTNGDTFKDSNGVFVPEAIKASQENIAGHVGQIREVCLLVEDLKRLRAQGKSRNLLEGEFQPLWLQADGIIALAAPVEEEEKTDQNDTLTTKLNQRPPLSIQKYQHSYSKVKLRSNNLSGRSSRSGLNESKFEDIDSICLKDSSRRSSYSLRHIQAKSSTEVARKVMESIHQQRSNSDPLLQNFEEDPNSKMPFDTTSLKDLVNRAAALSRALNQVIRVADGLATSIETQSNSSSPAFIRVFTDPMISSPKSTCQKNSNSTNKVDLPPLPGSQVRHMMAVG